MHAVVVVVTVAITLIASGVIGVSAAGHGAVLWAVVAPLFAAVAVGHWLYLRSSDPAAAKAVDSMATTIMTGAVLLAIALGAL